MNEKSDKIKLLQEIAEGKIDPAKLPSQPVIVSNGKETFTGLMISVTHKKHGNKNPVVFVGEAADLLEECKSKLTRSKNDVH